MDLKHLIPFQYKKGHKFFGDINQIKELGKSQTGYRSPKWKGEKVSYSGLHKWIATKIGKPSKCIHCGIENLLRADGRNAIQWANVDHEYKRDLSDWIALCTKCHFKYDKKFGNKMQSL